MSGRVLAWVGSAVVVIAAAGLAAYLAVAGLSRANELAGVLSGFVALAGLGIAVYGVVQAHKDAVTSDPRRQDGNQSVAETTARSVTQVKGVTGNVRVGRHSSPAAPGSSLSPATRSAAPTTAGANPSGGQTVTGSNVSGDVSQVDGIGGDVDIDQ